MIVTTPIDGTYLVKVYSDQAFLIEQADTGKIFSSAVDLLRNVHVYRETDTRIVTEQEMIDAYVQEQERIAESLKEYSILDDLNDMKSNLSNLQEENNTLLECVLEMSEVVYS